MSRHINVNPGHYKVAGRERQGEAIHQSSQKGAYAQQREEARRQAADSLAGLPAWETTPPNLDIPDRPKARTRKSQTRKSNKKQTRKAKAAGKPKRKATAKRKTTPERKTGRGGRRSRS